MIFQREKKGNFSSKIVEVFSYLFQARNRSSTHKLRNPLDKSFHSICHRKAKSENISHVKSNGSRRNESPMILQGTRSINGTNKCCKFFIVIRFSGEMDSVTNEFREDEQVDDL